MNCSTVFITISLRRYVGLDIFFFVSETFNKCTLTTFLLLHPTFYYKHLFCIFYFYKISINSLSISGNFYDIVENKQTKSTFSHNQEAIMVLFKVSVNSVLAKYWSSFFLFPFFFFVSLVYEPSRR